MVAGTAQASGGPACKSHRPVHAFEPLGGGYTDSLDGGSQLNMDQVQPNFRGNGPAIERIKSSDMNPDPQGFARGPEASGGIPAYNTRLDWVGRNHGSYKHDASGRDIRKTNFLYCDGHVETKWIYDTFVPWQWGDKFYSLTQNGDVLNSDHLGSP